MGIKEFYQHQNIKDISLVATFTDFNRCTIRVAIKDKDFDFKTS